MQNPKLTKEERKIITNIHAEMQNIAKMPRWVEWSSKLSNIQKAKEEIRILRN